MNCKKEQNLKSCPCTYDCVRRGICCECIRHHRSKDQLPACYFSPEVEKSYDRSIANYIKNRK